MTFTLENAQIIFKQLGGQGRLKVMIGAHNFAYSADEHCITFKFKGSKKFNFCKVVLDPDDTYNMILCKINRMDVITRTGQVFKTKESYDGLFWDQLQEVFERHTKLYLSL